MISTVTFEQFTGTSLTASIEEMLKALDVLADASDATDVGSALLCAMMRKQHNWGNEAMSFNHPRLIKSAITRHISRGNILLQCDETNLISSLQSLVPLSSDRLVTLHCEVLAILTGAADVTEYVRWTSVAEVVAKKMQIAADSASISLFVDALKDKGIHHPVQVRSAIEAIAAGLEIAMPKRAGSTDSANDKKADTAPTFDKVTDAMNAFITDRIAGTDPNEPFMMSEAEATSSVVLVARVVRQLLAAEQFEAVLDIKRDLLAAIRQHKEEASLEPIDEVLERLQKQGQS